MRKSGYYWVRILGTSEWTPASFDADTTEWFFIGNSLSISEQIIEEVGENLESSRVKAIAWDVLDTEIGKHYPENNEGSEESDEFDMGLVTIGEMAASAFGYLN